MVESYDGKLSCTVLRGKGAGMPLIYPIFALVWIWDIKKNRIHRI
jgi:hypothetical protein